MPATPLTFGIRWELNTTEITNAANTIVDKIGSISTAIFGLLASGVQWDNFTGLLGTKINNLDGNLNRFSNTLKAVTENTNKFTSGLSIDTMQKLGMGFAQQSTISEKYSKDMGKNMQSYSDSAGILIKGMDMSVGDTNATLNKFRKTLLMSYDEMPAFNQKLIEITKTSNLSNKEQKILIDQTLKLANAYGLVGKEAQAFMLNQQKLTSTLSQLGLEADVVQRKLNAMADGTEEGAIQALLLGYDPLGDQKDTAAMLKDKASQLVNMAEQSGGGIALENMIIQQMAPAFGMSKFGIQDIRGFARGGTEEAKKEGLTPEDINKQLLDYLKDKDKSSFQLYQTTGQLITDAFKDFQMYLMTHFQPALEEFKNGLIKFRTETLPKIQKFIDDVLGFVQTIRTVFGFKGEKDGLANIGTTIGLVALAISVLPAILAGSAGLLLTVVTGLIAGASTAAVLGTIVVGLIGGGLIGKFINDHLSENMKKYIGDFLYNIPDFFEKKLPGLSAAFNLTPLGLLINGIKKASGAPTQEEVARGETALANQPGKTLGQSAATRREELSKINTSWAAYNPMDKIKPEEVSAGARKGRVTVEEDTKALFPPKIKELANWDRTDISKLGEALGLVQTSNNAADLEKNIPGRAANSLHKINKAEDFSVKGLLPGDIMSVLEAFKAQGFTPKFEMRGEKPAWLSPEFYSRNSKAEADHLHVEDLRKTQDKNAKPSNSDLATSENGSSKMLKVRDETLADKLDILTNVVRGQGNQSPATYTATGPIEVGPPSREYNAWGVGNELLSGVRMASGESTGRG